jgi:hypothetical protein
MPYATLDDVQRRMPQFQLTAVSKPNLDTAQTFLDVTHAQFDSAAQNLGYVTPITGPMALQQSQEIVAQGTIAKILYARGAALGTEAAFQSAAIAQKQYDHALMMLADPRSPAELTDAVRTSGEVTKPGPNPMGLLVDEDGFAIEPRITLDSQF